MAFVDELTIHIRAGNGGNGVVRWRHEHSREFAGPSGGNGGRGGDVVIVASRDVRLLASYSHQKEFAAGIGENGMKDSCHGKNGKDLELALPVGSIVRNLNTEEEFSLEHEGERIKILSGGSGGFGNEHFKSSTNTTPKEATSGKIGESADFLIEVQLIAAAGFIGLPNAGKSSLLNAITRAQAKVGSYAFTTLEPNLGEFYGFVLADIPGLIEGAAEGKGLGHKFLRHIRRTGLLVHCISLEDEDLLAAYTVVRNELTTFDAVLEHKKEIIVLTKTDTVSSDVVARWNDVFSKMDKKVYTISILDDGAIAEFKAALFKELEQVFAK